VALSGSQVIADTSLQARVQQVTAQRVSAPYALVAGAGAGLPTATVGLARQLPGVTAAGLLPTTAFLLDPGLDNSGSAWNAAGLDPAPGTLDLGVQSGSLTSLAGDTIAVSSTLAGDAHLRVGAILHARLADLTPALLRVGAIYQRSAGLADILLPMPLAEAHAAVVLDSVVYLSGPPAALARLGQSTPGAVLLTRAQFLATVRAATQAGGWATWLLIAPILVFAALALLNTALMATAGRRPEFTLVRLIGATGHQVRWMITWEALATTLAGVAAGALIARVAVRIPPGQPGWRIVVPPVASAVILGGALLLGLAGALAPAYLTLRAQGPARR
jgi:putative ABC transport system permease protein